MQTPSLTQFDPVEYFEKLYGHMPEPRAVKVRTLFDLAMNHKRGAIVELGTYHGLGTAALCLGLELSGSHEACYVYTVDDFNERKGWAGEQYEEADEQIFKARMKLLGYDPLLIKKTAIEAAETWDKPVGLLFWDTGSIGNMLSDMQAWDRHILSGGIVYLHDTYSNMLGSRNTLHYFANTYKVLKDIKNIILLEKL